ncbi:MAG: UvrB/UvrC motif-containing protein, partial [Elusimicrobia bacterium]|nr:UvrB/UvrC motif-containing protein [Elusimicrobiota bacterium]
YLWRSRLFPLRPCRWEFSLEKPLAERKIHSCLYYHTGQCPAPCAGKISRADYRAVAERALLFFQGDYGALREKIEEEMQRASSELEYERAAALRNNLSAIAQMGERVRLKALSAEDIAAPLLESQAVTDLKDALGLAKTPFHIECFDISHFQGRFTVASMVCFTGGRPNKNHYRRFKIRETTGINDFKSMAEAVFRRYRRRAREDLPDLILIDGGKGQLGAATESLDKLGLDIPVASLAKRLEEIFVPGRSRSILLERRRPALRMFQHLRDEAHRFAITYNRYLRGKGIFSGA